MPKKPPAYSVRLVDVTDLAPYERNARTHPQDQIEQIKESIRRFGFANPIIADMDDGGIIAAGHGRLLAVEQMLDSEEVIKLPNGEALPKGAVPVVDCSAWSEDQRRAYTLADNKIAENSGWDDALLKLEIGDLLETAGEDAPLIGFSDDDLKSITEAVTSEGDGNYTRKIEAPVYEPKGDKPDVDELLDRSKVRELTADIEAAEIPEDIKTFLLRAAERHTVFDFERVAEFYCHADAKVQDLMERSALVIIDIDKAIEGGFVELSEAVSKAWDTDHGDEVQQ